LGEIFAYKINIKNTDSKPLAENGYTSDKYFSENYANDNNNGRDPARWACLGQKEFIFLFAPYRFILANLA